MIVFYSVLFRISYDTLTIHREEEFSCSEDQHKNLGALIDGQIKEWKESKVFPGAIGYTVLSHAVIKAKID